MRRIGSVLRHSVVAILTVLLLGITAPMAAARDHKDERDDQDDRRHEVALEDISVTGIDKGDGTGVLSVDTQSIRLSDDEYLRIDVRSSDKPKGRFRDEVYEGTLPVGEVTTIDLDGRNDESQPRYFEATITLFEGDDRADRHTYDIVMIEQPFVGPSITITPDAKEPIVTVAIDHSEEKRQYALVHVTLDGEDIEELRVPAGDERTVRVPVGEGGCIVVKVENENGGEVSGAEQCITPAPEPVATQQPTLAPEPTPSEEEPVAPEPTQQETTPAAPAPTTEAPEPEPSVEPTQAEPDPKPSRTEDRDADEPRVRPSPRVTEITGAPRDPTVTERVCVTERACTPTPTPSESVELGTVTVVPLQDRFNWAIVGLVVAIVAGLSLIGLLVWRFIIKPRRTPVENVFPDDTDEM